MIQAKLDELKFLCLAIFRLLDLYKDKVIAYVCFLFLFPLNAILNRHDKNVQ